MKTKPKKSDVLARLKALLYMQVVVLIIVISAAVVAVMNSHLANQASIQSLGYLSWSIPLFALSVCYRAAVNKYLAG